MDCYRLVIFGSLFLSVSAWTPPFYPVERSPVRVMRYARPPRHTIPPVPWQLEQPKWQRPKRERDYYDHDHDKERKSTSGVTGPVHTFVKTDKNANYKWGVRHHVGNKYAS